MLRNLYLVVLDGKSTTHKPTKATCRPKAKLTTDQAGSPGFTDDEKVLQPEILGYNFEGLLNSISTYLCSNEDNVDDKDVQEQVNVEEVDRQKEELTLLYLHDTVKNEETTKSNSLSLDSEDRFLWSKVSVTNDVIDTICKGGKLLEQRGSVSKRKALLGFEDELIAIQLCAAKVTELKDRTAEEKDQMVSDYNIWHLWEKFTKYKLASSSGYEYLGEIDEIFGKPDLSVQEQDILQDFDSFCERCNMLNLLTVLSLVKSKAKLVDPSTKHSRGMDILILLDTQRKITDIELILLKSLLSHMHKVYTLHLNNEGELSTHKQNVPKEEFLHTLFLHYKKPLDIASPTVSRTKAPDVPDSIAKCQLRRIILSYLRLLVNSRDEISLARVINVPPRGLNHKAFTNLRKTAMQKKMPMFQAAVSYILQIRLGGKSYAPSEDNLLAAHVKVTEKLSIQVIPGHENPQERRTMFGGYLFKYCCVKYQIFHQGLSEFVDLMNKLQAYMEESLSPRAAITSSLRTLKFLFVRAKIQTFTANTIADVVQSLESDILSKIEQHSSIEIPKSTITGLKNILILKEYLDAGAISSFNLLYSGKEAALSGILTTPEQSASLIKIPSLNSQFRESTGWCYGDQLLESCSHSAMCAETNYKTPELTVDETPKRVPKKRKPDIYYQGIHLVEVPLNEAESLTNGTQFGNDSNYSKFNGGNIATNCSRVVYAMVPRPSFSKRVLRMIKIMTDGRSVDVISDRSYDFMKNEQDSDGTERKSARAATVCLFTPEQQQPAADPRRFLGNMNWAKPLIEVKVDAKDSTQPDEVVLCSKLGEDQENKIQPERPRSGNTSDTENRHDPCETISGPEIKRQKLTVVNKSNDADTYLVRKEKNSSRALKQANHGTKTVESESISSSRNNLGIKCGKKVSGNKTSIKADIRPKKLSKKFALAPGQKQMTQFFKL